LSRFILTTGNCVVALKEGIKMDFVNMLLTVGAIIGASIGIFLVCRQIVLWYFRLNQIAENLQYIADHFREQDRKANTTAQQPPQPSQFPPARPRPSVSGVVPNP
jgi:hypothetical protein